MIRGVLLCAAAGAALSLSGCQNRNIAPPAGYGDPVHGANYPRVVMLDGLQQWVVYDAPRVTREGTLDVAMAIRNVSDREINAQYRFRFLDGSGVPVGPEPEWQYVRLPIKAREFIRATALDSRALDWEVQVRPAR